MSNSVEPDQTAPIYIGAVCSGSMLFASLLKFVSTVMLGNYLQQTTSADVIFQIHFFLGALKVNSFRTNRIFHKATYNEARMVHCAE